MTDQRLFAVSQAAKRLHLHPETIRRYIRKGRLAAVRTPGGTRQGNYLIAESVLEDFLRTSHNISTQPPS